MKNEFTEEEKRFIEENFLKMKYIEIAEKLNRSKQEINMYCFRNGLSKRNKINGRLIEGMFNVDERENWVA